MAKIIYVEEQREADAHAVTKPRIRDPLYLFVKYEYGPITLEEEDQGLEWWFPRSNGDGYPSIVHNATLLMPDSADKICLFLQSPDGETRVKVYEFHPLLQCEQVPEQFVTPHNSRGIIVFDRPDKDQIFTASYLVERI